jgi:ATP/maltotriose-dependent transcriptional regulator MalT
MAHYPEADDQASAALHAARQAGHEVLVGFACDALGFARALHHGDRVGMEEICEAREVLLELGDTVAAAWPTMHVGTVHRRHNRTEEAVAEYREAVRMTVGERDKLAAHNARVNLEYMLGLDGEPAAGARLLECEHSATTLSLAFVRHKAAFFRGCLDIRAGRQELGIATLKTVVAAQVELGHLSFLGRELLTQWDVAERLLAELADDSLVAATIDAIARHTDSRPALARAATLGEMHALAALTAAERWHTECEQTSLARSMLRLPFRRARERAAAMVTPEPCSPEDRIRATYDLTTREAQVLGLVARGLTNQEIQATLHVSPGTVKTHVNHIFRKLEVTDRVAAVLRYTQAAEGAS